MLYIILGVISACFVCSHRKFLLIFGSKNELQSNDIFPAFIVGFLEICSGSSFDYSFQLNGFLLYFQRCLLPLKHNHDGCLKGIGCCLDLCFSVISLISSLVHSMLNQSRMYTLTMTL